jgi:hypothetical protein
VDPVFYLCILLTEDRDFGELAFVWKLRHGHILKRATASRRQLTKYSCQFVGKESGRPNEGEFSPEATVKKFLTVRREGNRNVRRELDFHNLYMIISVGYRGKA